MKITILGSGTSYGIPVVGCSCPVCKSDDSRDRRMRSSVYIEGPGEERLVIDTGPEFRLQAVRAGIQKLDAVLFTHSHADHIHGLDDVRPLSWEKPLPVYGNTFTIEEMKERFSYVFRETQEGGGKPKLVPLIINGPLKLGGLSITPVPVKHGNLDILGWHIAETLSPQRSFLYLTDTSAVEMGILAGFPAPELFVVGALRVQPHKTHFNFDQALSLGLKVGGKRVFLTHICHEHAHREIEGICRNFMKNHHAEGIEMGPVWDGMEVDCVRRVVDL